MTRPPFDNGYDLLEALSDGIRLKRLEDVQPDGDFILHDSRWWKVTREKYPEMVLDLELAGSSAGRDVETCDLTGPEGALVVVAESAAGFQFIDGVIQDVPWPSADLIHVGNARRRRVVGADPDERIYGIFSRHHDSEGDPYYYPVDRTLQPGVASDWLLDPKFDLILDWEPIDVAGLLERMQKKHG